MPAGTRDFASPDAPRRYAPSRAYDLRHLRLDLELDPRRRHLRGSARLDLTPINDGLREVQLDLSSDLRVTRVRRGDGRALAHEHVADRLEIQLPQAVRAGHEVQVGIDYEGTPRRGLHFVGPDAAFPDKPVVVWSQGQDEDSKFWFPCWDSPNDKATSELRVTVPRPYRVISNGKLLAVEEDRRRRTRTFHWREEFPHPAYLVSVVIGDFIEVAEVVDGVDVMYYVPAHDGGSVERTFGRTPAMLRFFAQALEYPYPFEKYAQVVVPDFVFGGMENISATTLTDAVLLDDIAAAETHSDWLISHELAHQWCGNLLTCKEWSHAWLNEGFATYFECLFSEHHRGHDEFLWHVHANAEAYFREDADKYRRPLVERRYRKPVEIFDAHLYEKGALILHVLRFELGDALFWKALRHYVRKHQFQSVETADFKIAIEEATGRHLDAFFEQWVLSPGYPQLDVSWGWEGGHVRVQVEQTQSRTDGTPVFDFPLEVELGAAEPVRHRLRVHEARQTFHLPSRDRPRWVRVDPDHWILKRLRFEPGRHELLAQLDAARDLFGQIDAARGLARFAGDTGVAAALHAAFRRARFFAVRGALAQAMAEVGGENARSALLAALADRNPRVRRRIVLALAQFKDDADVASALRRQWRTEKSYMVRAEILTTLAAIRAPDAFERCAAALDTSSFRDVIRSAALRAFDVLQDERGIDLAMRYAAYGQSRWTRAAAMSALAGLARTVPHRARRIQEGLEQHLRDRSFWAQLAAAESLGKLGRPAAVEALRRLEKADVDGRLQKAARDAIAALQADARQPEAWQSMQRELEALRRDNQGLRERIARLEAARPAPARPQPERTRRRRATPRQGRSLTRTRARASRNARDRS